MDSLDRKVFDLFSGRVVPKGATKKIKDSANVPTYVLEYLLGTYCTSDDPQEIEAGIEQRLVVLPEFTQTEVLLAYLDFGPEVRTRGIIQAAWDAGKTVALPWCVPSTHEMRWFKITSFDDLVRSSLGVEEPVPVDENEQSLGTGERMMALVPGLTFDPHGYRLGYGGGFYDTFLSAFPGVSVALCRSKFLQDDPIDRDVHDLSVGIIVTDAEVVRLS